MRESGDEDTLQVLGPHLDTLSYGGIVDIVLSLLRQRLPPEHIAVLLLKLQIARYRIPTEHIATTQELFQQLLMHQPLVNGI